MRIKVAARLADSPLDILSSFSPMRRLMCLLLLLFVAACSGQTSPTKVDDIAAMQTVDQTVGSGMQAHIGDTVKVQYTGWLYDAQAANHHGAKFDSSYDHGGAFSFTLGTGQVIQGWDKGVVGMHAGGKRELLIPSSLGYGTSGAGGGAIAPNSGLVFEVELVGVE